MWISIEEQLPPEETPVLVMYRGEHRILERCWEHPTREDGFRPYWFWDDPNFDGQNIDCDEVTHWMFLPEIPIEATKTSDINVLTLDICFDNEYNASS